MAYRGHVRNGVVELENSASLPEGAEVSVDLTTGKRKPTNPNRVSHGGNGSSLYDRLSHVIGKIDDLPSDFSRNHDHYLYGTPKK